MTCQTISAANIGKAGAYFAYNVGLCVPVGLVRTVVAIYHLVVRAFYHRFYREVISKHPQANYAFAAEFNRLESFYSEGQIPDVEALLEARCKKLNNQLKRGLVELCWLGSTYYTYRDFNTHNVSYLCLKEFYAICSQVWEEENFFKSIIEESHQSIFKK